MAQQTATALGILAAGERPARHSQPGDLDRFAKGFAIAAVLGVIGWALLGWAAYMLLAG